MSLISQTVASHRINFDHRGTPRIFQAPGRVNLIGDHTDYNDGFVLPAAITEHYGPVSGRQATVYVCKASEGGVGNYNLNPSTQSKGTSDARF